MGSALRSRLQANGDLVVTLRREASADGASNSEERLDWIPDEGLACPQQANGLDAFVHLAGHSIGNRRWSQSEKDLIRSSRITATRRIADQLAELDNPPKTFICASAIGLYGDQGAEIVDETHPKGNGFLADVVSEWEAACLPLQETNIRVCHARFGIVLDPSSGALKKMLPIFKLCLGTRLGNGKQYWSWISLADCVSAIEHLLSHCDSKGAYNFVSPNPLTNREFTRQLGSALNRLTPPLPAFMTKLGLRLAMGEMADELLLTSCRVLPARLLAEDFQFQHPELTDYLSAQFEN